MSNAYITIDRLKATALLDITGTGDDTELRLTSEAASRDIDRAVNRHFYTLAQTKEFSGDGGTLLLIPDLIVIDSSGLKTDDNKDRTFETTWATTDYILMPPNADPTGVHDGARPYTSIEVDVDAGNEDVWTQGVRTVQIAGQWGYSRRLLRATEVVNEELDATETGIDVDTRADVEAGHTILVDSEQMYVKSYSGNTLTVLRGVNGTTAATHSTSAVIDIYEYPSAIVQATIMLTARIWKRKDSAFASVVGMPDGSMQIFKGRDADVKLLLSSYRKAALGVGV